MPHPLGLFNISHIAFHLTGEKIMTGKKKSSAGSAGTSAGSTVNADEIAQFNRLGHEWWDESGPMAPLHRINPVRVGYIKDRILAHTGRADAAQPLKGLTIADIGCGGGLLAEALCQLGATVTGIDAGADNIAIARAHARQSKLDIDYRHTTAEDVAASGARFDIVTALEIIEHVENPDLFVSSCARLVKPDGLLFVSTLNRTPKAFLLGIVAAEYILRWLKPGTHTWRKFVRPSELSRWLRGNGFHVSDISGLVYRPSDDSFALDAHDLDVNYILTATRD